MVITGEGSVLGVDILTREARFISSETSGTGTSADVNSLSLFTKTDVDVDKEVTVGTEEIDAAIVVEVVTVIVFLIDGVVVVAALGAAAALAFFLFRRPLGLLGFFFWSSYNVHGK